jgi:iron complex outermembrane receptor protein
MNKGNLRKTAIVCGLASAWAAVPAVTIAQETAFALEEVIVTARKRQESLQDVPVSVTALSEQLSLSTVRDLKDTQEFVPNLLIEKTPGNQGASVSIRGISFQETDKSFDAPVGIILDGVFLGSTAGALLNNFDIERIEVLRGPQGTLFGKNTIGGAINVIRSAPTKELGGKLRISAGDFGKQEIQGLVNLPLTENGGLKIYGSKIESDGYIENDLINEDMGGADYKQLGATLAFDITDSFDLSLTLERSDDDSDLGAWGNFNKATDLACFSSVGGGFYPGIGDVPAADTGFGSGCMDLDENSDEDHSSMNAPNTPDITNNYANLTMNWLVGGWGLTSITGYMDRDEELRLEYDASFNEFLTVEAENTYEQFSQEFRINGSLTDNINLTAGLYYWKSEYEQFQESYDMWYYFGFNESSGFGPGDISQDLEGSGDNEAYAVFASVDWSITDRLLLNLGGRYTYEEKSFTGQSGNYIYQSGEPGSFVIIPQGPTQTFEDDWGEFSPRIALQYTLGDDAMVFGSYSNGFKSGGFFARTQYIDGLQAYDPEYVDTFEVGVKSELWDNRIRLNATAFYTDYTDKQEDIIQADPTGAVGTVILNASDVEMMGLELEFTALLTEKLTVFANFGYIDSEYSEFDADLTGDGIETDNSGLTLRNTPETSFGVGGTFAQPLSFGELVVNYNYFWRDEFQTIFSNDPLGQVDAAGFHNASFDLYFLDHYRVSFYGRNLSDERYARVILIPPVSNFGQWNEPRNYGVEFVMDF